MNRFRLILMTAASVLLCSPGAAGKDGKAEARFMDIFTFGVEWSYIATPAVYRHFNYISSYGYRVDIKRWNTNYHSNGELLIHAGCDISRMVNLSIYGGYSGIYTFERIYPLSLRVTVYYGDTPMRGRWFSYADAGVGFSAHKGDVTVVPGIWKLGGGYRIPLSRHTKLDFLAALRVVKSETGIADTGSGSSFYVPQENLRRKDILCLGVMVGIGLTF